MVHEGEVAEGLSHLVSAHVVGAVLGEGVPSREEGLQGTIILACLRAEGAQENVGTAKRQEEELGHGEGANFLVHEGG